VSLKNYDQLRAEIDAAVHTNGSLGKTTALGLNAVLRSFATELITLPSVISFDAVAIEKEVSEMGSALVAIRTTLLAIETQATGYTLQLTDAGKQVPVNSSEPSNVIVPADSIADFAVGTIIEVSQENVGQLTITGQPNVIIQAPAGAVKTSMQYGVVGLRKVAANIWRVQGGVN
jgi:hypothetical protein